MKDYYERKTAELFAANNREVNRKRAWRHVVDIINKKLSKPLKIHELEELYNSELERLTK